MRYLLSLIVFIPALLGSCDHVKIVETEKLVSYHYIKTYLPRGEPCETTHFIRIQYDGKEVTYSSDDPDIVTGAVYSSGFGVNGRGYSFRNTLTDETVEVIFYFSQSNPYFHVATADYFYGNPWYGTAGANVELYVPVNDPENPYSYYLYLGGEAQSSYFRITYFNSSQICGEFYTFWKECCGGVNTYWATGEFSIPYISF